MYLVYALYSERHDKIYIGYTSDIEARLNSHNGPRNKGWTSRYRPWVILYKEEHQTKHEALVRERELKSAKGRAFIRSLLFE